MPPKHSQRNWAIVRMSPFEPSGPSRLKQTPAAFVMLGPRTLLDPVSSRLERQVDRLIVLGDIDSYGICAIRRFRLNPDQRLIYAVICCWRARPALTLAASRSFGDALLRCSYWRRIHVFASAGYAIRMNKPAAVFRMTNWSYYTQALKRRGALMIWCDPDMPWFAAPRGKVGHPERFGHLILPVH